LDCLAKKAKACNFQFSSIFAIRTRPFCI